MGQRCKRKDDALRRWRKRKARLKRLRSRKTTTGAPVQIIGDEAAWAKLGNHIATMIQNEGLARLVRVRELIATDANLPMPPIRILPTGWWYPQCTGVIYGLVKPIAIKDRFEWGVIIPASTLVVVDDDTVLRRILCHEFAHCFWYNTQAFRKAKDGKWISIGSTHECSIPESVDRQLKMDKSQLIDPADWFGKWDVKHFVFEGGQPFHESTHRFATHWLKEGLPTQPPDMSINVEGTLQVPDEMFDRVRQLDEKAGAENKSEP